jgi:predicted outer membrane repeat protein
MTSFFNVDGLISISESRYYYLGPQFALLAIDIVYTTKFITNTTIIVVDTEIYRSGVALAFFLPDIDASDSDRSFLDILLENVLISGPYYIGLGFEIASFWGFCNVTILNSTIQRVNGTALSLGLDNPFTPSAVIKNSQLRWNYGRDDYGVAMVIRGYDSAYPAVVELFNVTVESNTYSDTVTTMMDAVNITMSDCTFRNNTGTAVFLEDSFLECSGHSEFTANIGYEGACLSLGEGSRIFLATNETRLTFAHNIANYTGGAIYLRTNRASYIQLLLGYSHAWCFVQEKPPSNSIFLFHNNTANGGDDIFGEYFDFRTFGDTVYYCIDVIANMSTFAQKSVSSVTSPPSRVCLCEDDGTPRCLEYERSVSIYPGQTVGIQAFTVGQQFGTVRGAVYAQVLNKSSSTIIPSEQKVQTVGIRNCTDAINTLKYKLATGESETLVLTAVNIVVSEFVDKAEIDAIIVQYRENLKQNVTHVPRQLVTLPLFINLDTLSCPRGFALGDSGCQCHATFLHHVGRYMSRGKCTTMGAYI